MVTDKRIKEYRYLEQLDSYISLAEKQYLNNNLNKEFIYPKQLEIHLPSDRQINCNLKCKHCFGTLYKKELGKWEVEGLKLLHNLNGDIKYHIYGGSYTEPTMSPFLFPYLDTTKHYENWFGIHTNAVLLNELQNNYNFFNNLHDISTDRKDYISISLDAGNSYSWKNLKKGKDSDFWNIIKSIETMSNIREKKGKDSHAIRIAYLVSEPSCSIEEFEFVVSLAKMFKLDSVRFSVPYGYYNQDFEKVRKHKVIEDNLAIKVEEYTRHLISKSEEDRPYVFWNPPYFTDVERFNFDKCYYGSFQITLGADGFIYPCSAVAAPSAHHLRKGKIDSDLDVFRDQIYRIQKSEQVNCKRDCFSKGLRGNRMALEINEQYNKKEM